MIDAGERTRGRKKKFITFDDWGSTNGGRNGERNEEEICVDRTQNYGKRKWI